MDHGRPEILQGTLDLMILKALAALGPLHGFGIARRLELYIVALRAELARVGGRPAGGESWPG